jgi:Mce-associated membrane protein
VEDQQPDSGDLTTDAAADSESPTPRARHRMPRGKERRALTPEAPEAKAPEPEAPEAEEPEPEAPEAEAPEPEAATGADEAATAEEPSAPAEPTTPTAEEPQAKPRRRWNFLRRSKKEAEPTAAADTADESPSTEDPATETSAADKVDDAPTIGDTVTAASAPESEDEATESEDEAAEEEPEPVLVPHKPAGRRLKIAAAAAAVLFVAGAAFVAAMAQPMIANRAMVQTKLDIARTAQSAITTLWSYTPDNMDSLGDRSARYLTGDFASQYRKFIDSIVASNKQAQVTNTTDVLGTAVESVSGSEATALVYTNSVATSPVSKNIPSLRYLSYRLEMKLDHSDWRITRMTTITTLDLTPQL